MQKTSLAKAAIYHFFIRGYVARSRFVLVLSVLSGQVSVIGYSQVFHINRHEALKT